MSLISLLWSLGNGASAIICGLVARYKRLPVVVWVLLGLVLGPLALIPVALAPRREPGVQVSRAVESRHAVGWFLLVLGPVAALLMFIGFMMSAKEQERSIFGLLIVLSVGMIIAGAVLLRWKPAEVDSPEPLPTDLLATEALSTEPPSAESLPAQPTAKAGFLASFGGDRRADVAAAGILITIYGWELLQEVSHSLRLGAQLEIQGVALTLLMLALAFYLFRGEALARVLLVLISALKASGGLRTVRSDWFQQGPLDSTHIFLIASFAGHALVFLLLVIPEILARLALSRRRSS